MGVYIDMKMPKDREIYLRIDEKGEVYVCGSYPTELYKAVYIPPHGRLIDADEQKKNIFKSLNDAITDSNPTLFGKVLCTFIAENIVDEIENAPTIIPASKEET